MSDPRERLTRLLADCYDDPELFNTAILNRPSMWWRQREIARSVVEYRQTIVYSGNQVGKDWFVGCLIPFWLYCRSESLIIATAPSQTTLGTITWKELRKACDGSGIPLGALVSLGTKNSPQVCAVNTRSGWQALGYSTTNVERASGQHNAKLLVIVEEASGVEDPIWEAVDSLGYDRLLAIGNPIRADGEFVRRIRRSEDDKRDGIPKHLAVNAIQIPSTDSPHATWEKSPIGLADKTWIDDNTRHYGKDSLWVRSHIKAEIPVVSADTLIPEAWLDWAAAQPGRHADDHHPLSGSRRISCDLGEGVGRDSSCIVVRDDRGILEVVSGSYLGLAEAASRIFHLSQTYAIPPTRISYDRVGIGRDFHLHLKRMGLGDALGYAGAGKPLSGDFTNLRTEAAWKLRKRLDPEGADDSRAPYAGRPAFVIPPMDWWPRMREELKALTYSLAGRKTALLSKEDHCTVLGHSPDLSDALLQSFAW